MNKVEKQLLIQIIANVDDIKDYLAPSEYKDLKRNFDVIYGNYQNILDGVGNDEVPGVRK